MDGSQLDNSKGIKTSRVEIITITSAINREDVKKIHLLAASIDKAKTAIWILVSTLKIQSSPKRK